MFNVLKLHKAVYAIIIGIMALIAAQLMRKNDITGSSFVLGVSGVFLIIGALLFLYPILFAKKVDGEGENVELQPIEGDGESTEKDEPEA